MLNAILDLVQEDIGQVKRYERVTGGDISDAFLLESPSGKYFLKLNMGHQARDMFDAERQGLEAIAATGCVRVPGLVGLYTQEGMSALVLEHIESKTPTPADMECLGEQLAAMHQQHGQFFGWENDNFIGSLLQSNFQHANWTSFFISERIRPMADLALKKRRLTESDLPNWAMFEASLEDGWESTKPSLLHGDLWSGNYLVSTEGKPYLIDPAVYYGHPSMDIGLTKLFGGFSPMFYDAYNSVIGNVNEDERLDEVYKLYPLLVHLNLFGRSYHAPVKHIFDMYR